jgi:hypothetical protein
MIHHYIKHLPRNFLKLILFKNEYFFFRSQVAQAHELPPSPVAWDKL